jgi:hypothetical protein
MVQVGWLSGTERRKSFMTRRKGAPENGENVVNLSLDELIKEVENNGTVYSQHSPWNVEISLVCS